MSFFGHFAHGQPTAVGVWLTRKTMEQQFDFVVTHVPRLSEAHVLEIGPGRGDFAAKFFAAGCRIYDVIEPDEALQKFCAPLPLRNVYSNVIPPLPGPDAVYDLVIMCDVFEHMNDTATAVKVLAEINRVLRPGGRFFVLSPDYNHWQSDFFNCDFSHSNPTTVRRMNQMLYNVGFETTATTYHYTFLTGAPGWIIGNLVKFFTTPFRGDRFGARFYSLRLCFLRRFLMIAQKKKSPAAAG